MFGLEDLVDPVEGIERGPDRRVLEVVLGQEGQ
jgi:hypothetical protein